MIAQPGTPAALGHWSRHAVDAAHAIRHLVIRDPGPHRSPLGFDIPLTALSDGIYLASVREFSATERAAAVGLALSYFDSLALDPSLTLADRTAAWVWAGGRAPGHLTVITRRRQPPIHGLTQRHVTLAAQDVTVLAGIPVLAPHRTFAELHFGSVDQQSLEASTRLLDTGWVSSRELREIARSRPRSRRQVPHDRAVNTAPGVKSREKRTGRQRYQRLAKTAERLERALDAEAILAGQEATP